MTITTPFFQAPSSHTLTGPRNGLLEQLSPDDFALLEPGLVQTSLDAGAVLHETGQPIRRVYFPSSGLVSLVATVPEGHAIDTAMVGREGAIGLAAGLGCRTALSRAVVLLAGEALQLTAVQLSEAADRSKSLRAMIARHQDVLLAQAQQTVACNTLHPIQARLCRWLLQAHDRTATDSLALTQEFLSGVLGVQRTTITLVSRILQSEGILHVRRGHIHIRDLAALESKACDCYRTSRELTEQMGEPDRTALGA